MDKSLFVGDPSESVGEIGICRRPTLPRVRKYLGILSTIREARSPMDQRLRITMSRR